MKKSEYHVIPEEENKCIWMTTGLISYKLCALDFCCEDCLFDQVMRNEMIEQHGSMAETKAAPAPLHRKTLPDAQAGLFYHQRLCWARVEGPEEARIGIDALLTKLISRVKTVVLPQGGEVVTQGQCFAHIIQDKHILPLISPLTGVVRTANPLLQNDPQLLIHAPWDAGWLITIKPENLERDLQTLLCGRNASQWYQEKEQVVAQASAGMLHQGHGQLGATLQDGGEQVPGFVDMLSPEQLDQLIELLSRTEGPAA